MLPPTPERPQSTTAFVWLVVWSTATVVSLFNHEFHQTMASGLLAIGCLAMACLSPAIDDFINPAPPRN